MKRIFLLILIAGSAAFAGENQEPVPTPSEAVNVEGGVKDSLKVLAKHLALTEEQKSEILPIIIERRRKIQEVWNSSELFVRQKQVQVRGINKESDRRVNALLSGDQQKAYAALERERKVQRRLRRVENEQATN